MNPLARGATSFPMKPLVLALACLAILPLVGCDERDDAAMQVKTMDQLRAEAKETARIKAKKSWEDTKEERERYYREEELRLESPKEASDRRLAEKIAEKVVEIEHRSKK